MAQARIRTHIAHDTGIGADFHGNPRAPVTRGHAPERAVQVDAMCVVEIMAGAGPLLGGQHGRRLEGKRVHEADAPRPDEAPPGRVEAPSDEEAGGVGGHGDCCTDLAAHGGALVDADTVSGAAECDGSREPCDARADDDDV